MKKAVFLRRSTLLLLKSGDGLRNPAKYDQLRLEEKSGVALKKPAEEEGIQQYLHRGDPDEHLRGRLLVRAVPRSRHPSSYYSGGGVS